MQNKYQRREFLKTATMAGLGLGMPLNAPLINKNYNAEGGKIGLIGLDTSHVIGFTRTINDAEAGSEFEGFKIVAAYPTDGSPDMPASIDRIEGFTEKVREMGVEIVDSIEELLKRVDFVILTSVDGRRHLAEALPVFKAGKRMFIDKPLSNSLVGAIAIFEASKKYNVPVFSCSASRFTPVAQEIAKGKENIGKVLGVNTHCPSSMAVGHLDMAFYGIHAIESLFTLMGTGCKKVVRVNTSTTDVAIGTWNDDRVGIFRSTPRGGRTGFGATVYGEEGIEEIAILAGYRPQLVQVMEFFRTGIVPIKPEETLELFAFMKASDESKLYGGAPIDIESLLNRATRQAKEFL